MKKDFITKLRKPHLVKRIIKKIHSFFFYEQWILLAAKNTPGNNPPWNIFKRFMPPPDRIWADPFIWEYQGKPFVFFEDLPISTQKGVISYFALDDNLDILQSGIALKRPYHLSYPFLFEYEGKLFMMPETGENRTIEIYHCKSFPDQWELAATLMENVNAYDATFLEANGKWWLFVNIAEPGEKTWDKLHLFHANSPLSNKWTAHPQNPIVDNRQFARPAGKIFTKDGEIIRPSQDCLPGYGYAINFNRIITLNETEYAETCEGKFTPTPEDIFSTHTWNKAGDLLTIDAIIQRSKLNTKYIFPNKFP